MNLLCLTLLAAAVDIQGSGVEPLGWSKDGRYFVWHANSYTDENPFGIFDMKKDGYETVTEDDLNTWKVAHPLAPLSEDRSSPDGKASADVKLLVGKVTGSWKDDTWSPATATGAELSVMRDGERWVSVFWNGSIFTAKPYWSPDGRQIAWVVRPSDWQAMDGSISFQILFGPGGFPRVHIVGEKALLPTAGAKVKELLDGKGFMTTYVGKAKKARDASVVYAAAGREELAKKAAALIPGGATVEKLTWPANAELVVAIGKKAVTP